MGLDLAISDLAVDGAGGRRLLTVAGFAVPAGTLVGVRGPSGAGKSTFLYALGGLARGAQGRLAWGGTDLLALPPSRRGRFRRDHVGIVFQDALLFEEMGARANAAVATAFAPSGARGAIRRAAADRLEALGVPAGRRAAATYSGGERQRIALARALAADPAIVLADEPTASLDAAAKGRLVADLVAAARAGGRTLVAVSHDTVLLDAMDRVVTIEQGEIVP